MSGATHALDAEMAGERLPKASVRLLPPLRANRRRVGIVGVAVIVAVLLHLLIGGMLLLHPPAFLRPVAPKPQPSEQPIQLEVQNNTAGSSDAPAGDQSGPDRTHAAASSAPPVQTPPAAAPAPPNPAPPVQAPVADAPPKPGQAPAGGEVQAPIPQLDRPDPTLAGPPLPDPAQAQDAAAPPPAASPSPAEPAPDVRLAESDDIGVSGGDALTPAKADPKVHNRKPAYPIAAARLAQQGEVTMFVHVGADGTAQTVVIANSSGSPSLDTAALKAVQKWRFKPALSHGVPVPSDVPVAFNFVLN